MSAEVLREAAALMRERAEAAPAGSQWGVMSSRTSHRVVDRSRSGIAMAVADVFPSGGSDRQRQMAEHVASFASPVVALAVADWLDEEADVVGTRDAADIVPSAFTVARAYLGSDA